MLPEWQLSMLPEGNSYKMLHERHSYRCYLNDTAINVTWTTAINVTWMTYLNDRAINVTWMTRPIGHQCYLDDMAIDVTWMTQPSMLNEWHSYQHYLNDTAINVTWTMSCFSISMYIINTAMPRSFVLARWFRHLLTTPEQTSPAVLPTTQTSTLYVQHMCGA